MNFEYFLGDAELAVKAYDCAGHAGDFLVSGDDGCHLPVKRNGKPDHRLMAAARAALGPKGFRGKKYSGPDKDKAIAKLKELYKAEGMEWDGTKSVDEFGVMPPVGDVGDGDADNVDHAPSDGDADNFHDHNHVHLREDGSMVEHGHDHEHDQLHGADQNLIPHSHMHEHTHDHEHDNPPDNHTAHRHAHLFPHDPGDDTEHNHDHNGVDMPRKSKKSIDGALFAVKSLGDTRIGGYAIRFANQTARGKERDLTGQFFTPNTNLGRHVGDADVYYHHGLDSVLDVTLVGRTVKAQVDKYGVWLEAQLDKSNKYINDIKTLIKQGRLYWSTGTAEHLARWDASGEIKTWPVVEVSLTPTPAEPRLNPVSFYKSLGIDADSIVDDPADADAPPSSDGQKREGQKRDARNATVPSKSILEELNMDEKQLAEAIAASVKSALDARDASMAAKTKEDADKAAAESKAKEERAKLVAEIAAEVKASLPAIEMQRPGFTTPQFNLNMKHGVGEFSFIKAIRGVILQAQGHPSAWSGSEKERDAMVRYAESVKASLAEGVGTLGGYLVPPEYMQDQFIPLLRARAVVRAAGPRVMPTKSNVAYVPSQTGGATAYWLGENATINASNLVVGQVAIPVKKLAALEYISNELLADASPAADQIVREDLAAVIALQEDTQFLIGDGTQNTPVGMLNWPGNTQVTLAADSGNGGAIAAADLFAFKRKMMQNNVPFDNMAWFCSPRTWDEIAQLKDSQGRYLLETLTGGNIAQYPAYGNYPVGPETSFQGSVQGRLFGWPVYVTNNIPENVTKGSSGTTSYLFFVRMPDVFVVERMGLELAVTNIGGSAFATDQTWIRAIERVGFGIRHSASVVYANGLT